MGIIVETVVASVILYEGALVLWLGDIVGFIDGVIVVEFIVGLDVGWYLGLTEGESVIAFDIIQISGNAAFILLWHGSKIYNGYSPW